MRRPWSTRGCCAMWGGRGVYQHGNQLTDISCIRYYVGRRSVFGTVTGYGLDVPVIESPCRRYLPHLSRPVRGLTRPPIQWVPVHTPEVKLLGHGADHPSPYSEGVKERVVLCLYSSSGCSWPLLVWIFSFYSFLHQYISNIRLFRGFLGHLVTYERSKIYGIMLIKKNRL